jgi:hypothetical protein
MAYEHGCVLKELPGHLRVAAAEHAIRENPANAPRLDTAAMAVLEAVALVGPEKEFLAGITSKMWPASGVDLSVSFSQGFDPVEQDHVMEDFNSWGDRWQVNVKFRKTADVGKVRVAEDPSQGYWSYLGTDILLVPTNQQTMNLAGFGNRGLQPESEHLRVPPHECGHTLGFPHDQLHPDLVKWLDPTRTIAWFRAKYGWNEQMVRNNVLNPESLGDLTPGSFADPNGIMCYQLPDEILTDAARAAGVHIPGGTQITEKDAAYARKLYPKAGGPGPGGGGTDQAWVGRCCQEQLGRPVTQGDTDWAMSVLKALGGGVPARTALALFWGTAPEGRRAWIDGLYRSLLGRAADQGGLNSFMAGNLDWPHVKAQMVGSDEYYNRAG